MRKISIRILFLALAMAGTFLVVSYRKTTSSSIPCEETMEECCKKKNKAGNDNMIWETLSGQFFTSSTL